MDFILNEAIEEDNEFKLVFSDESEGELSEEDEELNFIDDTAEEEQQDQSFYREVDNQPLKFLNQTRILMKLFKNLTKNILVKMICQKCLIQKIEKKLNLIVLREINQDLLNLKIHSYILRMLITHFFIRLFMDFFIIN